MTFAPSGSLKKTEAEEWIFSAELPYLFNSASSNFSLKIYFIRNKHLKRNAHFFGFEYPNAVCAMFAGHLDCRNTHLKFFFIDIYRYIFSL